MTDPLKQANRGCFLLLGSIASGILLSVGAFTIFAMGMGGGSVSGSQAQSLNFIFIGTIILVAVLCLLTPVFGLWGMVLVGLSTVKEITEDLKTRETAANGAQPYKASFIRARQAAAIGLAIYIFFNLIYSAILNGFQGNDILSIFFPGTLVITLILVPILFLAGSIGGGLLYARWKKRETATALGAVIGSVLSGLLGLASLITYLVISKTM